MDKVPGVLDALIVNIEHEDGRHFMPLFVKLDQGTALDQSLMDQINGLLKREYTPRHVPDVIVQCPDIPYTISGKKLEAPVKKLLMGIPMEKSASMDALRNPESMAFFEEYARTYRTSGL